MEQSPPPVQVNVNRKMLAGAISSILLSLGFETADKECLGTLTEMLQAFLVELGSQCRTFTEISGRTEPVVGDVMLGLIETGMNPSILPQYIKSNKFINLPSIHITQPQKQLHMLPAGTKQPLPSYIPHHFPPFPDSHAYVRTPTHRQPIIDYESVREKAAVQKKDIEKALTKYLAKTNPTHNLFDTDEANIFPLIACKPTSLPYLSALLPQDQIFDADDLEYDHKSQMIQQSKEQQKSKEKAEVKEEDNDEENPNDSVKSEDNASSNVYIDNPYLAATKLPKRDEMMDLS